MIDETARILDTFGTPEQRFDYASMNATRKYQQAKDAARAVFDATGASIGDTAAYRALSAAILAAHEAYQADMRAAQEAYRIEDGRVGMLDWSQAGAEAFDRDAPSVQVALFSVAGELDRTGTPAMF